MKSRLLLLLAVLGLAHKSISQLLFDDKAHLKETTNDENLYEFDHKVFKDSEKEDESEDEEGVESDDWEDDEGGEHMKKRAVGDIADVKGPPDGRMISYLVVITVGAWLIF